MNINDVIEDGNRYYKLSAGKTVKVVFENKFEKKVSDYNGKTSVKYECACTIKDGIEVLQKTWSGSSKFYQECLDMAGANGMDFGRAVFNITRTGEGAETRYTSVFVGEVSALS